MSADGKAETCHSASQKNGMIKSLEDGEIRDGSTKNCQNNSSILSPLEGLATVPTKGNQAGLADISNVSIKAPADNLASYAIHVTTFPLTEEELDHAKSLVLDLLGWGVSPEYLVESGVSAPVIHRIFTDLHLRLPNNLSLSDIMKH